MAALSAVLQAGHSEGQAPLQAQPYCHHNHFWTPVGQPSGHPRADFVFLVGYRGTVHPPSDDKGTERTWFEPEERPRTVFLNIARQAISMRTPTLHQSSAGLPQQIAIAQAATASYSHQSPAAAAAGLTSSRLCTMHGRQQADSIIVNFLSVNSPTGMLRQLPTVLSAQQSLLSSLDRPSNAIKCPSNAIKCPASMQRCRAGHHA